MTDNKESRKQRWNLEDALSYYDGQIGEENGLTRIFIEPPDDATTSGAESDDEIPKNISTATCEIVLRNGKRYKSHDARTSLVSDKNSDNKTKKSVRSKSKLPAKRIKNCDDPKVNSTDCDDARTKRKLVAKRKNNCGDQEKVNLPNCDKAIPDRRVDKPENLKEAKTSKTSSTKGSANSFVWIDDSSRALIPIFPPPNYTDCVGNTAVDQFEKFFDNDLLALIVNESSKYASYIGKPDPTITIAELKVYIGILVISGYSVQPRIESYWSSDPDLRNELVLKSMRKNRFKQISQFLHFKDTNEPDTTDKIWKLRPLTDHLKKKMLDNFHPEQNLSYDESMIEYYGRHSMKQCLKPKPVPFGFKVWSLCTTAGYLVNFEIYQGKNPRSKTENEDRFGKSIAPLFSMIDDFDDGVRALPFSFYFDNLFTGIAALAHLKTLGYHGTGTIRENRLPQGCPLKEKKKETKKRGQGFMSSKSIQDLDIHVTQWVDNSVVRCASTVFGMNPTTTALRYSKADKKKIEVPRPFVVASYNKSMGGVDRMDENISLYRISIRGKKWWNCIFTWMVDVCIQNGWQLHRIAHPEMPQFDFRRELALYYCGHYGVPPKCTGNRKRKIESKDRASLRYDNLSHWPKRTKRRRCALESCKSSMRTMCAKCNVGLCVECFEAYHSFEKFKQ